MDPERGTNKDPSNQGEEPFDFKCPPNLQLNLSTGQSSRAKKTAELFAASITAVALQLSLVAIAAVVSFHVGTSTAIGYENNLYGFLCYAAGSALLCAGMAMCSAAIESSTDEFVWTRSTENNTPATTEDSQSPHNPYIMWIQQPQSVGDQTFDAYAILGGSKRYILTSSRSKDLWTAETSRKESGNMKQSRRRWWEVVTMTGVLLGSLGFIVQFIGLRGLPWPVAVSQLLATLIMALVRALIRRRVGIIPLACAAIPGYELDFLANEIVFHRKFREFKDDSPSNGDMRNKALGEICQWKVMTPNLSPKLTACMEDQGNEIETRQDSPKKEPQTARSQQLVNVRERLGDLCKWKTGVSETAFALAQLIEHFMTIFFDNKKPWAPKKIQWATKTSAVCDDGIDGVEETTVLIENKNGKWIIELGKLEAILSLWMASIKARELDIEKKGYATDNCSDTKIGDWRRSSGAKVRFDRVVGDGWFFARNDSLKRDISWWVGHDISSTVRLYRKEESNFSIGFDTPVNGSSLRL